MINPEGPLLISPANQSSVLKAYSFQAVLKKTLYLAGIFENAGYHSNLRIALLLGSTPEHYMVKLALNKLGISVVPVNPDYTPDETSYLLEDSKSVLVICSLHYVDQIKRAIKYKKLNLPFAIYENLDSLRPYSSKNKGLVSVSPETEASLLYTSGTTGRPKGCMLSQNYELMCGEVYTQIGNPINLSFGKDRVINPLPSYHINSGIVTFFGAMLTGNCLIQPERFSVSSWWRDIKDTEATIFHYLGVIIAVLLADNTTDKNALSNLRVGFGAGVEPSLHVEFEDRFGIPLIECWGMTEMCRVLYVNEEPRQTNTRAMGRPRKGLEVKVVNENDEEVKRGLPGEMVVRYSQESPRKGAFSGYLNKEKETEEAWKNGWFHTGDTVVMDETEMLFFVDRAKNIIRRSGENIAAAEIENCLFENDLVSKVACISVKDEVREEEVMACIVLKEQVSKTLATAQEIFNHSSERLAYYKTPGYILFMDDLPVTGTQKVVKHKIFTPEIDPRVIEGVFDFRAQKKRK
jgi:crotonobetaine/carnitine-CoA ligase